MWLIQEVSVGRNICTKESFSYYVMKKQPVSSSPSDSKWNKKTKKQGIDLGTLFKLIFKKLTGLMQNAPADEIKNVNIHDYPNATEIQARCFTATWECFFTKTC